MKLTLYHLPHSRSQRMIWLLEELQMDYTLIICPAKNKFDNIYQNMKFPTLQIQHHNQIQTLTESSAIAEYLCQTQQQLTLRTTDPTYWQYCFYKNFADASFMPNLALKQVFTHIAVQTPWVVRFVSLAFKMAFNQAYLNPEIRQQLQILEQHLKQNTWLAGNQFSYADILLWFPLNACTHAYPDFQTYTALEHYLKQIKSRPAFQLALQKGQWSADEFQRYWKVTQ